MFKALIILFKGLANLATRTAEALAELDRAWESKKPELEELAIDIVAEVTLDAEEVAHFVASTAKKSARGARKALAIAGKTARRAYRAIEAFYWRILPIVRMAGKVTFTGLLGAYTGAVSLMEGIRKGWEFRESLVAEIRA